MYSNDPQVFIFNSQMQMHCTKILVETSSYHAVSVKPFENSTGICFSVSMCLPSTFSEYRGVSEFVSSGYPPKGKAVVLHE